MIKIELKTIFGAVAFTHESEKTKVEAIKDAVREMLKKFTEKDERIENLDLSGMNLDGVGFDNSRFDNSSFDNSSFYNSSFYNSSFYNSSFYNSRFDNSSFYNSRFDNSSFYNSSFYNSSFYNSRFDNSRFDNSRFDNSSFDNSSFYNSSFYNSRFDNSRFDNSSFDNSSFYNSSFDNSRFDNSSFYNSSFYNSSFDNSSFDNSTVDNIRKAGQLAMFDFYKNDFWAKLLKLKKEIPAFKQVLKEGRIDGSCYEGECACFCGTFANLMKISHKELPGVKADAGSPVEVWFRMITKGMTPENSEIAKLTMEWIEEFEDLLK